MSHYTISIKPNNRCVQTEWDTKQETRQTQKNHKIHLLGFRIERQQWKFVNCFKSSEKKTQPSFWASRRVASNVHRVTDKGHQKTSFFFLQCSNFVRGNREFVQELDIFRMEKMIESRQNNWFQSLCCRIVVFFLFFCFISTIVSIVRTHFFSLALFTSFHRLFHLYMCHIKLRKDSLHGHSNSYNWANVERNDDVNWMKSF